MLHHKPPFILNELKIEVTYTCPLACIHCSSDSTPSSQSIIEPSVLLNIVNNAIELGVKEIAFSGGEPLLHPSIIDAVHLAANNKIRTLVYSSGCVDEFDVLIKNLIQAGLSKIIFSLYSDEAEKHEAITRVRGSHRQTVQGIQQCIKNGLATEVHFVALKRTYKSLTSVAEYTKLLGVNRLSVLRFVPQGRGYLLGRDMLTNTEYAELKTAIENLRNTGMDIRTGSPFNFLMLSNNPKCNSAIDRLIIAPDLCIYPCDAFKRISAQEIVGTENYSRLEKGKTLYDCWHKSPYLAAVREYLCSPFAKPCDECEWLESCLSGCLAQKVLVSGILDKKPDPNCMRKYFTKRN
jgi:radical SAM protein with 4Fe4S-binding SPASM domain